MISIKANDNYISYFVNVIVAFSFDVRYTIIKGGVFMTVGDKIKRIRTFRGMTQRQLAMAVGLGNKGADNRIAQYEINYRAPKKELLDQMAKVLHVNPQNFYDDSPGSMETFFHRLLWLEEEFPSVLNLFQMHRYPDSYNLYDNFVLYHDSDDWPPREPIGIYFDSLPVNDFLKEWLMRKQELKAKEITHEEYFEWKLNWPDTCDDCGRHEPSIPWRKDK